jgi:predicted ATPase
MDATAQWALGYPARADRLMDESVALARKLRHPPSLVIALWFYIAGQITYGDLTAVIATYPELLRLSDENGLPQGRAFALMYLGWALTRSGETAEGIVRLEEGLGLYTRMGFRQALSGCLGFLGEGLLAAGRYAEGLEQVDRAIDIASEIGEQYCVPGLHIVRSELLLHTQGSDSEAAEASLRQALATARQQDAKGWELQAATNLARLWFDRGRHDEARELLAPVYCWFTEGFETPDLVAAKALLDALN